MTALEVVAVLVVAALSLAPLAWLRSRLRGEGKVSLVCVLVCGGALTAALAFFLERAVFARTELSLEVRPGSTGSALLALFAFAAPLEEGLKAFVVLPVYMTRRLDGPRTGLLFSAAVGAGFGAMDSAAYVLALDAGALSVVRAIVALPAHLFCAGLWGYALGQSAEAGKRWFSLAWVVSVFVHGLYDHIVFGRGPGFLVLIVPLLLTMGLLTLALLRELAPRDARDEHRALVALPEPPSLRAMRRALRRSDQPIMLHWIVFAALVNVGVVLVLLALAVYIGHRFGIDFAAADEADMRSNGPLVLLGVAVLAAFPVAGYLVARASGATSVLEPALGAALAIVGVVALLSVTAPIALLFALAVAPIAFGLACGGAWFGRER